MNATTNQEHAVLELAPQAQPLAVHQPQTLTLAQNSPAAMMLAAMDRGASLADISAMMALQREFDADEARKAFNAAFAAFKAEAITIIRGRKVTDGPLKGKSYAELHDVVDAVSPALSRHGLSTSWRVTRDEPAWIEVTCELRHAQGHIERAALGGPPDTGGAKNAIQARASTVSYLERYTLKAILGVADGGDDDDGNGGRQQASKTATDAAPAPLLQAGRDASLNGMDAWAAWWKGLSDAQRTQLTPEVKSMKDAARAADAAKKGGAQ